MCGISFILCDCAPVHHDSSGEAVGGIPSVKDEDCNSKMAELIQQDLLPLLQRRGPDLQGLKSCLIENQSKHVFTKRFRQGLFAGTVLHLRGEETSQPMEDESNNTLLWNGEIFAGDTEVPKNMNDGKVLLKSLERISAYPDDKERKHAMIRLFASIKGPGAFIYWQAEKQELWFGRDYFGRRSLLWHWPSVDMPLFILSSLATNAFVEDWEEVPAQAIFCIQLDKVGPQLLDLQKKDIVKVETKLLSFTGTSRSLHLESSSLAPFSATSKRLGTGELLDMDTEGRVIEDVETLITPRHMVSNDEANSHLTSPENSLITSYHFRPSFGTNNPFPHFELKSFLLEQSRLDEFVSSCLSNVEILDKSLHPKLNRNLDTTDQVRSEESSNVCLCIKSRASTVCLLPSCITQFIDVMLTAVQRRVFSVPMRHRLPSSWLLDFPPELHTNLASGKNSWEVTKDGVLQEYPRIGILFSGGIDSMFLASLVDRCIPTGEPVDLINVAFEKKVAEPSKKQRGKFKEKESEIKSSPFDVPDRITGRAGLLELNSKRCWNFIEVDVTLNELRQNRQERIKGVLLPSDTVLDDSIGCALWFAARGRGKLRRLNERRQLVDVDGDYISPVKVLLTGMGADEQLGGYARHRTKFEQSGWTGLAEEMRMELDRIASRNLGRDDRCISDHGREARFPFLDEDVVAYLTSLPVWIKCDPRLPHGIGEKRLLREAGKQLGLSASTQLPKRAIQFGSRVAKLESTSEKGSETCQRLR